MVRRRPSQRQPLTPRQAEVVSLIAGGHSNRSIAAQLGITEDGVKAHVRRLLDKYEVPNRAALVQRVAEAHMEPATDVSLRDLLESTTTSLAGTIGATAASSLIRRALRQAARDEPELRSFSLTPGDAEGGDLHGREAVDAFDLVMRTLWPLLLVTGGEAIARRLAPRGGDSPADERRGEVP